MLSHAVRLALLTLLWASYLTAVVVLSEVLVLLPLTLVVLVVAIAFYAIDATFRADE